MKFIVLKFICVYFIMTRCGSLALVNTSEIQVRGIRQTKAGCILPHHPNAGGWTIYNSTSQLSPGQISPSHTIIQVHCHNNYGLLGDKNIVCIDTDWSGQIGQCLRCGQAYINDSLIIGGFNAIRDGDAFPWRVAVYNATDKKLLCGGTLLNQRVIVTAAHCVTNQEGKLLSKELYTVAVGNYYRKYDHPNDTKLAQFSAIHEIYIPRQYKGDIQNFYGDVAILITKTTFQLSTRVMPACVDWGLENRERLLDHTRKTDTYVSGWGFTPESKNPYALLKKIKVSLISDEECSRNLPEDYTKFLTSDKLCAGFLESDKSVCQGDDGGGLVTQLRGRYYIIAVISISPSTQEGGCATQPYALYTKINSYNDFLLEREAKFRPSHLEDVACEDDPNCTLSTIPTTTTTTEASTTEAPSHSSCVLPHQLESVNWIAVGPAPGSLLVPGTAVPTGTILKLGCKKNYKFDGNNTVLCEDGKWSSDIGQCLLICPPRVSTPTMRVTCIYKNKQTENCTNAVEGTLAKLKCAPFYEDLALKRKSIHLCQDGEWDQPLPNCVPVCGQKTVEVKKLIINGTNVTKGDYPWQVALYTATDKKLICGGSLLSQKVVITAAHCITDDRGNMASKENYIVAAGKYYRSFNDNRDNEAQFSELGAMFVPDEYRGAIQNYLGDMAILITRKVFVLSRRVQPVCLDLEQFYNPAENEYGYVTGWGFTVENSNASDVLKELKVPAVTLAECLRNLTQDFEVYLTHDKLCAGYLDKGTSVCRGDSGGGLVFKHEGRYYITGIVSLSPTSPTAVDGCDSRQYGLYTKVANYINYFILPKLTKFKI